MARIPRGEIRWADLNPTRGREQAGESPVPGLPKRSWIKIGQIRTLATERIGRRLARVPDEELARVIEGLNEIVAG